MANRKPTLDSLISALLHEVSTGCPETLGLEAEWKHYMRMYDIIQQIQEKEAARDSTDEDKTTTNDLQRRKAKLPAFLDWLKQNGVDHEKLEIVPVCSSGATSKEEFDGFGLKTKAPIHRAELVFQIQEHLMITTKNARESKLEILTMKDPLLRSMDNVLLTIFLIYEKYISREASFWKPYIDILPTSYDTVMYFKPEELKLVTPSVSAFRECLKMYRNIARQYAYFHNIFRKATDSGSRALKNIFTYKRYAWAVSTVITRQNVIPRPNALDELSLVPLWDLCNHQEDSNFSTDYNVELKYLVCYASQDYEPGDDFKIFYGFRSSVDYFVHGGFVPQTHINDIYNLELGISKNDPNFGRKKALLMQLGLQHPIGFSVTPEKLGNLKSLFLFVRLFLADKDFLDKIDNNEVGLDILGAATEQTWKFLITRFTLLKQSAENNLNKILKMIFKDPVSQDEKQLTVRQLMVLQLFKNNKKALELLAACANDHLSQLMKPTEAAAES